MDDVRVWLVFIALTVLGAVMVVRPEWCWKLEHFWDTEGGGPSQLYLTVTRLLGTALLLMGAVALLVSIIYWIFRLSGLM